ncbi:nuclear transport factor 2 family protein [Phenylobacterium sp.]|jgi:hypothetical protein|uniref:nuclear transport factor 2 family protein n=1 Tax=Phenylobacterium sp. TaxID=1871053 RepID=UPI0037C7E5D6
MTGSEIETTLRAYAMAWRDGDLATLIGLYDDAVVLHWSGGHGLAGSHVGKPAALAALAEMSRRTNRELVEVVDILAGETRGAIIAVERLGHGAARTEVERTLVYRVGEGRLLECWVREADPALVDRLVGD